MKVIPLIKGVRRPAGRSAIGTGFPHVPQKQRSRVVLPRLRSVITGCLSVGFTVLEDLYFKAEASASPLRERKKNPFVRKTRGGPGAARFAWRAAGDPILNAAGSGYMISYRAALGLIHAAQRSGRSETIAICRGPSVHLGEKCQGLTQRKRPRRVLSPLPGTFKFHNGSFAGVKSMRRTIRRRR